MKKNRIVILVVITLALILSSCGNNKNGSKDTTQAETSSIISTLTTTEAKYNFYLAAYEKTISLEQIDFKQDIAIKQVTNTVTFESYIENKTIYKKTDDDFTASGYIDTTSMNNTVSQDYYYINNATYINDGVSKKKTTGDTLNISDWNNKIISKIEEDGVSEISCIQVQNGIKVTIIGNKLSLMNNYNGYLKNYIEEQALIKSYRMTIVVNNDGYIVEVGDLLNVEEQHTIPELESFTINKTVTTNVMIKNPSDDVTLTPFDDYENYTVVLIGSKNKEI